MRSSKILRDIERDREADYQLQDDLRTHMNHQKLMQDGKRAKRLLDHMASAHKSLAKHIRNSK